jgi:TAG lipase / steryl ester hydrolase / phospholipase A2 / LPA acyltransferase
LIGALDNSASDDDDKELSDIDDGATDPISRNNLQYHGSSLEENLYCPLSVNSENATNTNKPEVASIFYICTEMHPASISLPEVSSEKIELETTKIPDDKSAVMNGEVASGAGN